MSDITKLIQEIKYLSKKERKDLFLQLKNIVENELETCSECDGIGSYCGSACDNCRGTGKELLLY